MNTPLVELQEYTEKYQTEKKKSLESQACVLVFPSSFLNLHFYACTSMFFFFKFAVVLPVCFCVQLFFTSLHRGGVSCSWHHSCA